MSTRIAWGFTAEPADRWRDDAACLDEDPERFFPTDIGSEGPQTVEAKAFCRVFCDVKGECLAWALGHGIDHGVWGGTTPAERRALAGRGRLRVPDPARQKAECVSGHPLTGSNVRLENGRRVCRTCHALQQRAVRARRRREAVDSC